MQQCQWDGSLRSHNLVLCCSASLYDLSHYFYTAPRCCLRAEWICCWCGRGKSILNRCRRWLRKFCRNFSWYSRGVSHKTHPRGGWWPVVVLVEKTEEQKRKGRQFKTICGCDRLMDCAGEIFGTKFLKDQAAEASNRYSSVFSRPTFMLMLFQGPRIFKAIDWWMAERERDGTVLRESTLKWALGFCGKCEI